MKSEKKKIVILVYKNGIDVYNPYENEIEVEIRQYGNYTPKDFKEDKDSVSVKRDKKREVDYYETIS